MQPKCITQPNGQRGQQCEYLQTLGLGETLDHIHLEQMQADMVLHLPNINGNIMMDHPIGLSVNNDARHVDFSDLLATTDIWINNAVPAARRSTWQFADSDSVFRQLVNQAPNDLQYFEKLRLRDLPKS